MLDDADPDKIDDLEGKERLQIAQLLQQFITLADNNLFQLSLGLLSDQPMMDAQAAEQMLRRYGVLAEKLDLQISPRLRAARPELSHKTAG